MFKLFGTEKFTVISISDENNFILIDLKTGKQSAVFKRHKNESLKALIECHKTDKKIFNHMCKGIMEGY